MVLSLGINEILIFVKYGCLVVVISYSVVSLVTFSVQITLSLASVRCEAYPFQCVFLFLHLSLFLLASTPSSCIHKLQSRVFLSDSRNSKTY